MVGPLKYFKRDPEGKGRGAGYYYHRGKGRWSKYSRLRDLMHKGKVGKKGRKRWWRVRRVGSGRYRHTHDFTKRRRRRR